MRNRKHKPISTDMGLTRGQQVEFEGEFWIVREIYEHGFWIKRGVFSAFLRRKSRVIEV